MNDKGNCIPRFAREPLVHFLLLGVGLFFLSGLLNDPEGRDTKRIVVSPGRIEHLLTGFSRTWQRPPTQQELEGLIEDYIKEEVLYREAQAFGLDQDDTVIRRRLRQKMEFLSEDFLVPAKPSEQDLQTYLHQHPDQFRIESKVSFTHVYLNADRRGDKVYREADRLRLQLTENPRLMENPAIGDPFPLAHDFELLSESQIANVFGQGFADHVATLQPDSWSEPVESGYGVHLVLVRERLEGKLPALDEVRDAVKREWISAIRREAQDRFYQRLREQYTVTVEYPKEGKEGNLAPSGAEKTK